MDSARLDSDEELEELIRAMAQRFPDQLPHDYKRILGKLRRDLKQRGHRLCRECGVSLRSHIIAEMRLRLADLPPLQHVFRQEYLQ